MRINSYVLLALLTVGLLVSITSCSDSVVNVTIGDPVVREKYLAVLDEKQISYKVDNKGIINVYMDHDELEKQMADYEKWRKEYWRKRGVTIIDKE
ncbi:MAG: hypothetical protein ABW098_07045 [Candidatus Thiodiazotropha sp.]